MRTISFIMAMAGISCGPVVARALAQPYDMTWHTISGGGGASIGGTFSVSGAFGQPNASAAGALTGGSYSLTGGFWSATLPLCTTFAEADFNHDCLVNSADVTAFVGCKSRAAVPFAPGCENKDFDEDGDVDGSDFAVMQRCYRGNHQAAIPGCGN